MYDQHNLVPHADHDRPFEDYQDVAQETVWHNPTNKDVALDLYVGVKASGRPPRSREEKTGFRRYVIKASEKRAIAAEFDRAIQDVRDGIIIGGLGPHLINVGAQERPRLHPSLDVLRADKAAAEERAIKASADARAKEHEYAVASGELALAKKQLEERDALIAKLTEQTSGPAQNSEPKKQRG